jgi:hypothetical protein
MKQRPMHAILAPINLFVSNTLFRRTAMFKTASLDRKFRPLVLLLALSAAFAVPSAFAFNSGSTGADGALAPTVNTTIDLPASGILNYTSINIPAGVTVKFKKNAVNTPVYLLVSGDVTIAGAIDVSGTDAAHTGTAGDGNLGDDGVPGLGGPGGFDGGRGGQADSAQTPAIIRGGAGLGPGGGKGGIEGPDSCTGNRYYKRIGGGAGYATNGGMNLSDICGGVLRPSDASGIAYGSAILQPLIGGSGGGGGRGGANFAGSGGGGGGGAILLASSGTINLTGAIRAEGGGAGVASGTGSGDAGAGGSGGAIRIMATAFAGNGRLSTVGACVNSTGTAQSGNFGSPWTPSGYGNSPRWYDCSIHRSSMGRIRVEAESVTYSGQSFPAYVADQPGPIFLSSLPALRIASVAGTAVPANPTGNADVVLPADVVNPVTVTFETTNVPTGNTVLFKMIPAYGDPVEVISPAIAGSAASGTASVQVSLPQGPSTLQATTTYTVVVAMGEALSRYAQNERVEKVQIIATLGSGENQAKLITVSGKEFLVPMAVLQTVGFAG